MAGQTEALNESVVEECVRGAIAVAKGDRYENINVDTSEVEKVVLFLAAQEIIALSAYSDGMLVRAGRNWLQANADAKLFTSSTSV